MKLTIKYNIELSKNDISFLRLFLDRRVINKILLIKENHPFIELEKLKELGLISIDITLNITLTELGKIVLDKLDRNKKIDQILE